MIMFFAFVFLLTFINAQSSLGTTGRTLLIYNDTTCENIIDTHYLPSVYRYGCYNIVWPIGATQLSIRISGTEGCLINVYPLDGSYNECAKDEMLYTRMSGFQCKPIDLTDAMNAASPVQPHIAYDLTSCPSVSPSSSRYYPFPTYTPRPIYTPSGLKPDGTEKRRTLGISLGIGGCMIGAIFLGAILHQRQRRSRRAAYLRRDDELQDHDETQGQSRPAVTSAMAVQGQAVHRPNVDAEIEGSKEQLPTYEYAMRQTGEQDGQVLGSTLVEGMGAGVPAPAYVRDGEHERRD